MDIPVPISSKFGRRFWQTHAKACTASGYSRSEYCRQHNLSHPTLTYWVRKQQRSAPDQPAMSLVEVPCPLYRLARQWLLFVSISLAVTCWKSIPPSTMLPWGGCWLCWHSIDDFLAQQYSRLSCDWSYRYAQVHYTLAVLVSKRLDLDPLSGHLFGFCNRKRDTIKILYWDRNRGGAGNLDKPLSWKSATTNNQ